MTERIITAMKSLVIVNGHAVVTGTSIGVAFYPQHGDDPDTLVNNADSAMYCAKSAGRNRYAIFGA